jgi:hypothetical protein
MARRKRPATKFVINPDSCYSLGLNVDRDHITLVLVDFAGSVRARASREVSFALPETVHSFLVRSARQLLDKVGMDFSRLVGLGVAFPDDIQRAGLPEQPPSTRCRARSPSSGSCPPRCPFRSSSRTTRPPQFSGRNVSPTQL